MTANYGKIKDTPSFSYSEFEEPEPFQYTEEFQAPDKFEYEDFRAPDPFTYEQFQAPEAFTYEKYVDNTPDFQHSDAYTKAMGDVMDYGDFAYDYTTDPLYDVYKKEYTREGNRAQADALAQAAALTGGIPSSYATMAGQQANNYYASKIADKIPELRNQAYNEWLNNYGILRDKYNAAAQGDQFDYGIYTDKKNQNYQQYLDDLNMRYGIYSDDYNRAYQRWADKTNLDYGIYRDNRNDAYQRWSDKTNLDYGIYRDRTNDAWNQYRDARDFAYNRYSDDYDRSYNRCRDRTNLDFDVYNNDYNRNKDVYGMSEDNYNRARDEELDYAKMLADLGDYSALDAFYGSGTKLSDAYKASLVPTGGYRGGGGSPPDDDDDDSDNGEPTFRHTVSEGPYSSTFEEDGRNKVIPDQMSEAANDLLHNLQQNRWVKNGVIPDKSLDNIDDALIRGIITEEEYNTILDLLGVD